ncbi:xanthine dehydrogenase family protein molybdopterin-binding subunit [Pelagibius litoralis]|uniref:Xanthine dehydrogenase family protein molybdopterin-binding subunit n=1 Tax=Pelagibius litoralis TaxID=374515 RepID=A0A967KAN6_9PROT|nr:molybdopterin cofactor-binding domain-containing protein [Pelagibius litoralis]NIA70587.1 xanthine dehydrogenase family protein molybdopterin-binding subunit [Pelagibius litoralis]
MTTIETSRRGFVKGAALAAGSLVLGFGLPAFNKAAKAASGGTLNAWLEITGDGRVRIAQPQAEMGQGIWTSMAQMIAEELEVDWAQVEIFSPVAAPDFAHPFYGFQTTAESFSIRAFWKPARTVGAQAREMLKMAAGEIWGVYPGGLQAEAGHIVNPLTGQKAPYAALVVQAAKYSPPENIQLKRPDQWKIIGKSIARADTPDKVNGSAVYGIDVKMAGLLTAVPLFPPSFTGKVKSVDDSAALKVKGVRQVVALEDAVYVLAEGYWSARQGREALTVDWDLGEGGDFSTDEAFAAFRKAAAEGQGAVVEERGDTVTALAGAAKVVDVTLEAPYLAHATMEPMNATAHYTPAKLTIWVPTQAQGLMGFVAGAVGLEAGQVECHTTFLGCGLGRRFEIDLPIHAALVSKAAGVPVKVLWSREDDTRRDFYRPGAVARLRAGVDSKGKIVGMLADISGSSILARAVPSLAKGDIDHTNVDGIAEATTPAGVPVHRQYDFGATARVAYAMVNSPIPVGFWRSVAHSQNAWFMEAFVNELAADLEQDPVALRLSLMKSERNRTVLKRLGERANWGNPAAGNVQGLAIHEAFGTVLGHVIEIAMNKRTLKLVKVTSVVDVGWAVNPDTVEAQVTSGAITGLTAALWGEVTMTKGEIDQGNFDSYRMLKLAQTPVFDVEILQLGGEIGGIGEPGTPPVAPALAHAVFNATGERIRKLPLAALGFDLM